MNLPLQADCRGFLFFAVRTGESIRRFDLIRDSLAIFSAEKYNNHDMSKLQKRRQIWILRNFTAP